MINPKISVIIPIYNVENYLEDTLNCLLHQTIINDIEVLMIDDGSTDNSKYIIEKYDLDYNNFYAFHKKNGGPSEARNFGLDRAQGEYVYFLDADDTITHDRLEKLYSVAIKNNPEIITTPAIRLKRYNIFDGKFYENSLKKFENNIYSTKFQNHPELIWDLFIHNKLFKLEFINKNNLRFISGNRAYCDDGPFALKAYLLSNNITILTDSFYFWRVREMGISSITQTLADIKTFFDRLDAVDICLNIIQNFDLNKTMLDEFYLKFLNHDLYLHFNKFYMYEDIYHLELIERAKKILNIIPTRYQHELNSYKKIIYKMIENDDINGLINFSNLEFQLKEDPKIPDNLNKKYIKFIDFNSDYINEKLIAKREKVYLNKNNLIITFTKHLNYLDKTRSCETIVKLIDNENNEFSLTETNSKIIIPLDLIKNKNHMKIKIECIFDSFKKECYLKNNKREILQLNNFDLEIGIGMNNLFFIDLRPTNDLILEIEDIIFEDNVFKFKGISNKEISNVFIQNIVTFDKISYDVISYEENKKYNVNFSIPYNDILSFPVRKWELKIKDTFNIIKLNKKFEFYNKYNFIYMINLRKKILISSDFYNIFEKLDKLKNELNSFKTKNSKLNDTNLKLSKRNKELSEKNQKLNNIISEYKSRKVVKLVDKLKK